MKTATRNSFAISRTGLSLLRTVLASYFIALALGLFASTNITLIPGLILGQNQANFLANTAVFILAYLVLMGIWIRPAAIGLAGYYLASSAFVALQSASPDAMGNLWRDLAMIAGLMMIYFQAGHREYGHRPVVRTAPNVRHVQPGDPVGRLAAKAISEQPQLRRVAVTRPVVSRHDSAEVINIFAA